MSSTQVRSNGDRLRQAAPLLDAGSLCFGIDFTSPLADATRARKRAARGGMQGKVVLSVA